MVHRKHDYEYLLGDGDAELDRLKFQQSVWGPTTRRFFGRLRVGQGWNCLDVGAGPGLVTIDLRHLVGDQGQVTALEPSEYYCDWFKQEIAVNNWRNVRIIRGNSFDTPLPEHYYDLVFIRWVIGFVPDPTAFLAPLISTLKPGGIIAVQDYVHEGCSFFPTGGILDRMPEAIRAWWRAGGGDPFVAAKLPSVMKALGLQMIDYTPNCLAGGPDNPVMEWMGRFLKSQIPVMVEKGILTSADAELVREDWQAHRENPDTVFFSPFVVDVAGRS
jgi:ubiquinone/menaquinone biosynthesis C-methylase UbiE